MANQPISNQVEQYIKEGDMYCAEEDPDKASAAFRKALILDPENDEVISKLASCLREWGRYREAEEVYRKVLKTHPDDYLTYVELGIILQDQNKENDARNVFDKAFDLKPDLVRELLRLASEYRNRGKDEMMKKYCKMVIAVAPDNYLGYLTLGRLYLWQNQKENAEKTLKQSIECNSKNAVAYALLGMLYERMNRKEEAKQMYKKALHINPKEWDATYSLIILYQREGNLQEAETLYKRMTALCPGNYRTWGALATFYEFQERKDLAEECYNRADKLRLQSLNSATVHNYRKLYEILQERKIPPVFMQYPMRHLKDLSDIFRDETGIIFIDNEYIFKEAVKRDGYVEYFNDHFAGDFGHCNPRGNRLLAGNIVDSLFLDEEFFNRKEKSFNKINVLSSKELVISVSSTNSPEQTSASLIDNNPTTYWHISLDQVGLPAWIVIDFGENKKRIQSLVARPRQDSPKQFIRNAQLLGSDDSIHWKTIAPIIQEEEPSSYEWSKWSFKNSQAFRYYKLDIIDGYDNGLVHHFYSIAELAMFE
jgi:tetratricopeptide (TPR) repeat protein